MNYLFLILFVAYVVEGTLFATGTLATTRIKASFNSFLIALLFFGLYLG